MVSAAGSKGGIRDSNFKEQLRYLRVQKPGTEPQEGGYQGDANYLSTNKKKVNYLLTKPQNDLTGLEKSLLTI